MGMWYVVGYVRSLVFFCDVSNLWVQQLYHLWYWTSRSTEDQNYKTLILLNAKQGSVDRKLIDSTKVSHALAGEIESLPMRPKRAW